MFYNCNQDVKGYILQLSVVENIGIVFCITANITLAFLYCYFELINGHIQ